MSSTKSLFAGAALAALAVVVATPAAAQSYYLQEQSARGAGRAFSGEAADTGVASLWWNPAAIARSGREVTFGAHAVAVNSEVRDAGSTLTYPGGVTAPVVGNTTAHSPIESGIVPNFAIATPIGDRFAVGLAIAAPYNFTTKYEADSFARYDAMTSELRSANVGLVGAMRVTDWLDLGAGVDAQYAKAKLTSALPNLSPTLPDGFSSLEGDGWAYGWNVGAQAHFGKLDLGLSYRSAIEHELDGDVAISGLLGPLAGANLTANGVASFNTPSYIAASARYAVNDRLTLNAQVNRIGWSEFDTIDVVYPGGGQIIPLDYKDVTTGAVGFDYVASDRLTFRGGIGYTPTPTRANERTARIPDSDRWLISGGLTAKATDRMSVDLGLTYIAFQDGDAYSDRALYAGTPAAMQSSLRGTTEGYGLVWSLGTRMAF
ncbi:OmpP1/FadL family transporter [Brevundimonas sp. GCM10030266]|uniref:OmpP1/FadL family transporter n=1 Tax=Brevundimonas sp. GCM10030266 TaxID=3273386 RepID=UPI00360C66D6